MSPPLKHSRPWQERTAEGRAASSGLVEPWVLDAYEGLLAAGCGAQGIAQIAFELGQLSDPPAWAGPTRHVAWSRLLPGPGPITGALALGDRLVAWGAAGAWSAGPDGHTAEIDVPFGHRIAGGATVDSGVVLWSSGAEAAWVSTDGVAVLELEPQDVFAAVKQGDGVLLSLTWDGDLLVHGEDGALRHRHAGMVSPDPLWNGGEAFATWKGLVASVGYRDVALHDPQTGEYIGPLVELDGEILGLAAHADRLAAWTDTDLAIVHGDGAQVWRLEPGLSGATLAPWGAVAWGNGVFLVGPDLDDLARDGRPPAAPVVWAGHAGWRHGEEVSLWTPDGGLTTLAFPATVSSLLPMGPRLGVVTASGLYIVDQEGSVTGPVSGHGGLIKAGISSGSSVITAGDDGTVRRWEGTPSARLATGPCAAARHDHGWLTWGRSGILHQWSSELVHRSASDLGGPIDGVYQGDETLWAWTGAGTVLSIQQGVGTRRWDLRGGADIVPGGNKLLAGSRAMGARTLSLLDLATPGGPAATCAQLKHPLRGLVAWGNRAVSYGERGEVRVWDASTGDEIGAVTGLRAAVLGAVSTADRLLVWSRHHAVEVDASLRAIARFSTDDDLIGADAAEDSFVLRTTAGCVPWGADGPGERVDGRGNWAQCTHAGMWVWSALSGLRLVGPDGFEAPDATGPPILGEGIAVWPEPWSLHIWTPGGAFRWWHDLNVRPHAVSPDEIVASDAGGNLFALRRAVKPGVERA